MDENDKIIQRYRLEAQIARVESGLLDNEVKRLETLQGVKRLEAQIKIAQDTIEKLKKELGGL